MSTVIVSFPPSVCFVNNKVSGKCASLVLLAVAGGLCPRTSEQGLQARGCETGTLPLQVRPESEAQSSFPGLDPLGGPVCRDRLQHGRLRPTPSLPALAIPGVRTGSGRSLACWSLDHGTHNRQRQRTVTSRDRPAQCGHINRSTRKRSRVEQQGVSAWVVPGAQACQAE